MKLGKANPIRSPRTEKFPTSGVACTREHEEDPPEQEPPQPCTQVTATQIPAKSQNSITATTYFEFVEVQPRQSEQRRQQCNSSPATSRTFEIDATAAVNSQRERRIQLQGNSPYTTRTQENQPRASAGSRPTPTRRRGRRDAGARRLAAHPKPPNRPNHIGPGLWTTCHRLVGESDRRHLSRGPMSAAIEQS